MTEMDVMAARAAAIERLVKAGAEAEAKARDPFWRNGPFNVQRWVQRGYIRAESLVRENDPRPGETAAVYLTRMSGLVYAERDNGPDADDEAWFASAIDEACMLIRG